MHNASVNRRDSPTALDEKQLVSLETNPRYEVHNITLTTSGGSGDQLQGSFALSLGGKRSRPISASASAAVVASAIREMLSNCEGAVGEELDSAGNTFDCWQGIGVTYRGLASKGVSGKTCLDWRTTPNWHPSLAVLGGLERNLCRNPNYDTTLGVWCYTQGMVKEACAVPRCGARQSGSSVSLLSSFEDEEDLGLARTASWDNTNGVVPTISRDQAFCGEGSLFVPNAGSKPRWAWWQTTSGLQPAFPYNLKTYPYICMAYRIPEGSEVSLQLGFAYGQNAGTAFYATLGMTNKKSPSSAPQIASFDIIADDQWHYTCLNMAKVTIVPYVNDLYFWAEGQPTSTYASNPFWIDEFSIATSYRQVSQTMYPQLGGIIPRLISVERANVSGGFVWTVTLTSLNCSAPEVQFDLNTSGLVGNVGVAQSLRIQEHSAPVDGSITLRFQGQSAVFGAYSEADVVRAQLSAVPTIQSVAVHRAGVCQTGYSWLVAFTSVPGDQPLLQFDGASLRGEQVNATVVVETVNDGGLLMAPLSADYFNLPADIPILNLWSNTSAAVCSANSSSGGCRVDLLQRLTPAIYSAQAEHQSSLLLPRYTITGSLLNSLGSNDTTTVLIGTSECLVLNSTEILLVCQLVVAIPTGVHSVKVNVPGRGWSEGNVSVFFPLTVTSVSPTSISALWPTVLEINGLGFDSVNILANKVVVQIQVDGDTLSLNCTPRNATVYQLYCLTTPLDSVPVNPSSRRGSVTGGVVVGVGEGQPTATLLLDSVMFAFPTLSGVTPTSGTSGGGFLVTLQGSFFSVVPSENTVLFGGTPCNVVLSDSGSILCKVTPSAACTVNVSVYVQGIGPAKPSSLVQFQYVFEVSGVTPNRIGTGGGAVITTIGKGFQTVGGPQATLHFLYPGWMIFVVGLYTPQQFTQIQNFVLSGQYINALQIITLDQSISSFMLTLYGLSTAILSRDINQYLLEGEVQKILLRGSVRIIRQESAAGNVNFQVEFRGNQGAVPLLAVAGCNASAICVAGGGASCTSAVAGEAPTGTFSVGLAGSSVYRTLSVDATALDWVAALSDFPIAGGVLVERLNGDYGVTWTVTFQSVQAKKIIFTVNATLISGGTVSFNLVREGTISPAGSWQLSLNGVSTRSLQLNASEADVSAAIMERVGLWSDVLSVDVIQADNVAGKFLNRFYPRQWVVRLQRWNAAGLGKTRCTDPQYIDWDPSACPTNASDLFLSYFPFYWPSLLPKPADLGSTESQQALQAACNLEAASLGLVVTQCQALRPLEILPYCGVGSGVNPPCWNTRFSDATVLFGSGQAVRFVLDESMAPSDTVKGYTFWQQLDLESALEQQMLGLNYTMDSPGAGMDITLFDSIAGGEIPYNTSIANETTFICTLPSITEYLRSYKAILQSDALYQPVASFRSGQFIYEGVLSQNFSDQTSPSDGLMQSGQGLSLIAGQSVLLSFNPPLASQSFTVDLWVRLEQEPEAGNCSFLLRALNQNGVQYALSVCGGGKMMLPTFQFWLNATEEATPQNALVECSFGPVGFWTHVAMTFDGRTQSIFGEGVLLNSTHLNVSSSTFISVALVLIGDGCNDHCNGSTMCSSFVLCKSIVEKNSTWAPMNTLFVPFQGHLDWLLWYPTAISAHAIAGHAAALSTGLMLTAQAKFDKITSLCNTCLVEVIPGLSPVLFGVDPSLGIPGASINLFGYFPSESASLLIVHLGDEECLLIAITQYKLTCNVSYSQTPGKVPIYVSVADVRSNIQLFSIVPQVLGIFPTEGGSLLGGATLTVLGVGFPANHSHGLSVWLSGIQCNVTAISFSAVECVLGPRRPDQPSRISALELQMTVGSLQASQQCSAANGTQLHNESFADSAWESCFASRGHDTSSSDSSMSIYDAFPIGACRIVLSLWKVATITNIVPRSVSFGSILTLLGHGFNADFRPIVTIGDFICPVVLYNQTQIQCAVGAGVGGVNVVKVRYSEGYALDFSLGKCVDSTVKYVPTLFSIQPNFGSAWGGLTITIQGVGFSELVAENSILIGGFRCPASTAKIDELIVEVPISDTTGDSQNGLERSIYMLQQCVYQGLGSCLAQAYNSSQNLGICISKLPVPGLQSAFPLSSNMTQFGVAISSFPCLNSEFLVDNNPDTVWRSLGADEKIYLVLDLGSLQTVDSIQLLWADNNSAASLELYLGSDCNQIVRSVERTFCWPWFDTQNTALTCGNGNQACSVTQSSTTSPYSAANALDGNPSSSCTQTSSQTNPWWRVDLNSTRSILGGKIWNRRDSFAERLDGFQVWVGNGHLFNDPANTLCYTASNTPITFFSDNFFMSFDCVGKGRYLYIILPRYDILSICEVEIYAATPSCVAPAWNLVDSFNLYGTARYIVLALLKYANNTAEYRLRDILVHGNVYAELQPVQVSVDSILAQCSNSTDCLFSFNQNPQIDDIYPRSGVGGDQIQITGSGLEVEDCSRITIVIGAVNCQAKSCTNSSVIFNLPEQSAGNYSATLFISPHGKARGSLVFEYKLVVNGLVPAVGGLGGGYPIFISGHGFNFASTAPQGSTDQVTLCNAPCNVQNASDSNEIICELLSTVQVTSEPGLQTFDLTTNDDVLEYAVPYCETYTMTYTWKVCYCELFDWMCYRERYSLWWGSNKAAMTQDWRNEGQALVRKWGCDCTGSPGFVITDGYQLGFDLVSGGSLYSVWSPQVVYLRFEGFDAPFNSTVTSSTLRVYATGSSCSAGSTIRIWAEAASNSEPLQPSSPGALGSRRRTQAYVDWKISDGWKWAYDFEQSADLSAILNEVVGIAGWNVGNAVTLILRQSWQTGGGPSSCQFFSSESGYSAVLRVALSNVTAEAVPDSISCKVNVGVRASPITSLPSSINDCQSTLSAVPSTAFPTAGMPGSSLNYAFVPVSTACCQSSGHLAYLALDSLQDTYWLSVTTSAVNFTVELGNPGAIVTRARILWTEYFASNYTVLTSSTGNANDWSVVQMITEGDGGTDEFDLEGAMRRVRFLTISICSTGREGQPGFGIFEVILFGCSQILSGIVSPDGPNLTFDMRKSLSPEIFSLEPTIGTTAGGTRVMVTGSFGANDTSRLRVDIGGFDCSILSANLPAFGTQSIVCSSGRVGVQAGGLKYVKVVSSVRGSGISSEKNVFWYIDRWSARTTWGGNLPPTGCGNYTVDPDCTDEVVIPEGQVILLDISPPRMFLITILGTLIFDRRDLELQVQSVFGFDSSPRFALF